MKHIGIIALFFLLEVNSYAASKPSNDLTDNMLDRLERKLLEQEAATLRIQPPPKTMPPQKPDKKLNYQPQTFIGQMPGSQEFSSVDKKLSEIEVQVEDLSQRVEKLQSEVMEKTEKGSLVEIQVALDEPETTALREMSISLDQYLIYQLGKNLNAWTPSPQIMVYSGPLEPGKHILAFKAQTLRRHSEKVPLDTNLFHTYNQEIKIEIPQGTYRRGYKLRLSKPDKQNTYALAVMETYEIP
jgi:hypothetical protein